MIEVQMHHRPGMMDESFEVESAADARRLLADECGVRFPVSIVNGNTFDLPGGGYCVILIYA